MSATAGYNDGASHTRGYNIAVNGKIDTSSVSGGTATADGASVMISSGDSISTQSITTGSGNVFMVAGSSGTSPSPFGTAGNITVSLPDGSAATINTTYTSLNTVNNGNVELVSTGLIGNIGGFNNNGFNISTNTVMTGNNSIGGAAEISTANGVITLGLVNTFSAGVQLGSYQSGGDVLLTSGNPNPGQTVTVIGSFISGNNGIAINTSQSDSSAQGNPPGQIWIVTANQSQPQTNVCQADTLQKNDQNNVGAYPVLAAIPAYTVDGSIQHPAQNMTFIASSVAGTQQTGSISGLSAGGYLNFSDSQGPVALNVTVYGGSYVNGLIFADTSLIVPVISRGTFSLTNSASSLANANIAAEPGSTTLTTYSVSLALVSSGLNDIQLGGNTPATALSVGGQEFFQIGTTGGAASLNVQAQSSGTVLVDLLDVLVNGSASMTSSTSGINLGGNNQVGVYNQIGELASGSFKVSSPALTSSTGNAFVFSPQEISLTSGASINLGYQLSTSYLVLSGGGASSVISGITDAAAASLSSGSYLLSSTNSLSIVSNLPSAATLTINDVVDYGYNVPLAGRLTIAPATGLSGNIFNGGTVSLTSGTGGITIQSASGESAVNITGTVTLNTTAQTSGTPTVFGPVNINAVNITLGANNGPTPLITVSQAAVVEIDQNSSFQNTAIAIQGPNAVTTTILTQSGGLFLIGPCGGGCVSPNFSAATVGVGDVSFTASSNTSTTMNFNGGPVILNTVGNITLNSNVTVSSDHRIDFLMNNQQSTPDVNSNETLTLNGGSVIQTTMTVTPSGTGNPINPTDPNNENTILIQALYGGFTLTGTGTFEQSGTGGASAHANTLFEGASNITLRVPSANLKLNNVHVAGLAQFFTPNLQVWLTDSGFEGAPATFTVSGVSNITIGSDLVSQGTAIAVNDVGFLAALDLEGAPVMTVGSSGSTVGPTNFTVNTGVNVNSNFSFNITTNTNASDTVTINGSLNQSGTNPGGIIIQSGNSLTLAGTGIIQTTAANSTQILATQTGSQLGIAPGSNLTFKGGTVLFSSPTIAFNSNVSATSANGTAGSEIEVFPTNAAGNVTIASGVTVKADGTFGNGGSILFANSSTNGNITVDNAGRIEATNTANSSGIVAFNGDATGNVTLSGNGTVFAGQYAGFGNINRSTLVVTNPGIVPTALTSSFQVPPLISVQQGSVILNQVQATGYIPPPTPPTPSSSSSTSGLSYAQILAAFIRAAEANFLTQSILAQQLALLDEQIGTRIATDYTPYTIQNNYQGPQFPLQGNVTVERLAASGQSMFFASGFNATELSALAHDGIMFGAASGGNFFDLQKGFVLFMPQSNINVRTQEGVVQIPKGAIAWIMETGHDVAIYDLDDRPHSKTISVVANNKRVRLAPGQQLLLTRNEKEEFENLNPGGTIGYRSVRRGKLGGGMIAYQCEFTISGIMMSIPVVRSLLNSKVALHRRAAERLLKNAAILADLTAGAGPFKTH